MSLLDDILKWTEEKLPLWQRDAARRLFQQDGVLSDSDYAELYALLKTNHGFAAPPGLVPVPLAAGHLPAAPRPGERIVLKGVRHLKHVNRIDPRQELPFAEEGLTLVYGGNGSGKSGYARVMKKACRARDRDEKVHPDASDPDSANLVPEATFDIEVNGQPSSVRWTANGAAPDELATVAVFDSHCARAYLTKEEKVAYLPYELDVVEALANQVLPNLLGRLQTEIGTINTDRGPYRHLEGSTSVGLIVANLSPDTDPERLEELGTFSDSDAERLGELGRALAEEDPSTKASELKRLVRRFKALAERCASAADNVSDAVVDKMKEADDGALNSRGAEKQAAATLRAGETLLPGTGEQLWKSMFLAARQFSTGIAYPGQAFPSQSEPGLCPLCQQPLNQARDRLSRFNAYVEADIARQVELAEQELARAMASAQSISVSFGLDDETAGEIESLEPTLVDALWNFAATLETRRKWLLSAFDSHIWTGTPQMPENPRGAIRKLAAQQLKSARIYDRAADDAKRKAMAEERDALDARRRLALCLVELLDLLGRMRNKQALESCKDDLSTKPISDKSRAFADAAVTDALKAALDAEFDILGVGHIATRLGKRNVQGKMLHQLLLDLPTGAKLEEILSEGEQRAIAIGSFLAELNLANHSSPIVLDDPVSSLDHQHRKRLAKRLISESAHRQVIVFTHEIVFLHQVLEECARTEVQIRCCFVEPLGKATGVVRDGLPWDQLGYKERLDLIEKEANSLRKLPWPAVPDEDLKGRMVHQYDLLRATVERVIVDVALNGTVTRFRDYVDVKKLRKVVRLEESDVDELLRIYAQCCDVVDAHDHSDAKNDPPPTPTELQKDLDDLGRVIASINDRRRANGAPVGG